MYAFDRRAFISGGAALTLAAFLSGCSRFAGNTSSDSAAPSRPVQAASESKKILRFHITNPACIDPYNCKDSWGALVTHLLFDSLTAYDYQKKELIPAAAQSWEMSADGTSFTFHLVPGALFHDGSPVTAASFKNAWQRICSPSTNPSDSSTLAHLLEDCIGFSDIQTLATSDMRGLEVVDEYTFKVTLMVPNFEFPFVVSHPGLAPVPEAAQNFATFYPSPIGNGPFKMDGAWVDGQFIKLISNENYYGTPASIDGINFMIYRDEEAAYAEFEAGNLDVCMIPTSAMRSAVLSFGLDEEGYQFGQESRVITGAEFATLYLCVNCADQVLVDPRIRRAISLAIDRKTICDILFKNTALPATGIAPKGIAGYQADAWPDVRYDVTAARALLVEAGFAEGTGPKISLSYFATDDNENLMKMVQGYLSAVGFEVTIAGEERWDSYVAAISKGEYQLGSFSWIADYPRLDNFLAPLFLTTSSDNRSFYSDTTVDAQLHAAYALPDKDARLAAFQALDRTIGGLMPVIPLLQHRHHHVCSSRVDSLYFGPSCIALCDTAEMTV